MSGSENVCALEFQMQEQKVISDLINSTQAEEAGTVQRLLVLFINHNVTDNIYC